MIKAVAVHCHGDTPNEINSSYLAEPRRLNDKLRGRGGRRSAGSTTKGVIALRKCWSAVHG
jgi:hypothetical protein